MRSVVQGLDTRASWNRYLRTDGEHDDEAARFSGYATSSPPQRNATSVTYSLA